MAKVNYHIHTDAIKENLIPKEITKQQAGFVYADEANLLNVALFGITAKEWRDNNADKNGNIRDYYATLVCCNSFSHHYTQFFRRFSVIHIMEKRRFYWILLLHFCCLLHLQAQWDDSPGQYWVAKSYFNPSFSGETEAISTSTLYRYKWAGIENAPRQLYLSANMPFDFFGKRHGAGLTISNETVGELRNSLLAAQYSFKKELGNGFLNIGLQAGVYDLHFDAGSKTIVLDSLQYSRGILRVLSTDKQVIDVGAGISWTGKSFFAGLSAMHLNQPRFYAHNDSLSTDIQSDSTRSSIPGSYNLIAGYNIKLFHPLEIEPMVWVQTDLKRIQTQATLLLKYDKKFSGGVSWRMNDGYLFFAGTTIYDVEVGYAYGAHTMGAGQNSKGSHELYLRYNFALDYFQPKKQPHKSIRLL